MRELKPCPICGGEVSVILLGDEGLAWWCISRGQGDNACKCRLFMESEQFYLGDCEALDDNEHHRLALIEKWNTRVENTTDVHEKIISCKDCVYYDETPIYTEASSELSTENCHMFSHFDIPYPVEADGFCYLGEPKGVK